MAKFNFFRSGNERGEYTAEYSHRNERYDISITFNESTKQDDKFNIFVDFRPLKKDEDLIYYPEHDQKHYGKINLLTELDFKENRNYMSNRFFMEKEGLTKNEVITIMTQIVKNIKIPELKQALENLLYVKGVENKERFGYESHKPYHEDYIVDIKYGEEANLIINDTEIDWKVFADEMTVYQYREIEPYIEQLRDVWIEDARNEVSKEEIEKMEDSLETIVNLQEQTGDKYMFLNLISEEYVLPSDNKSKFNEICKEILQENKLRKEMDYADNVDIANGFPSK